MCGIVGYTGPREAGPILIEGLQRLEYRGYDSAGIALVDEDGDVFVEKKAGKLANLQTAIADRTPHAAATVPRRARLLGCSNVAAPLGGFDVRPWPCPSLAAMRWPADFPEDGNGRPI